MGTGKKDVPTHWKHGAHSVWTRQRYSDLRTTEGKALAATMKALREDLGGNLTAGENMLLDRIRERLIVLQQIGAFVDRQESVLTAQGELIPCLGRGYTTYAEGLRRDIQAVYELSQKKPVKGPDLRAYLAGKTGEGAPETFR